MPQRKTEVVVPKEFYAYYCINSNNLRGRYGCLESSSITLFSSRLEKELKSTIDDLKIALKNYVISDDTELKVIIIETEIELYNGRNVSVGDTQIDVEDMYPYDLRGVFAKNRSKVSFSVEVEEVGVEESGIYVWLKIAESDAMAKLHHDYEEKSNAAKERAAEIKELERLATKYGKKVVSK